MTITLAAGAAAPTIAVGDTVTIPPGTIWDVTGSNDALGSPPALSGSFGDDVVTVTPTNAAPRIVNEDAGAVTVERLRFTALTNSVVITGLRIDRLGTATDLAISVNGVTIYHDQNADGVLGSGSFVGGTVTITAPLVIASGTTQDVLIVLDITGGAGKTIGVALLNSSYVLVASGDVVANTNFAVLSSITTIAAVSPHLTGAVASGDSAAGEDVHAGDTVTLVFNGPTNGFPITAANIAGTLVLNNSHLWGDGAWAIGSAAWSTSTFTNDTLTIVLSAGTSAPTVAVGDTITIAAGTVQDVTGTNDATGSPPSISGTFSRDTLTISATNAAPTTFDIDAGDTPLLKLTLSVDSNNVIVTQFTITLTGSVTPSDFARSGLHLVSDENGSGTIDEGDLTLGSVNVTSTTVTLPATVAVTSGGSTTVLTPYDSRPRQWSAAQSERN